MSTVTKGQKPTIRTQKKKGFFRSLGKQWQLMIMSVPMLLYVLLFNYGPLWGWLTAFQDYQPKKAFPEAPGSVWATSNSCSDGRTFFWPFATPWP